MLPANSSDLNRIKNLWDFLEQQVKRNHWHLSLFRYLGGGGGNLMTQWLEIDFNIIRSLIHFQAHHSTTCFSCYLYKRWANKIIFYIYCVVLTFSTCVHLFMLCLILTSRVISDFLTLFWISNFLIDWTLHSLFGIIISMFLYATQIQFGISKCYSFNELKTHQPI